MAELKIDREFLDMGSKVKLIAKNAPGKVIDALDKEGKRIQVAVKAASPYRPNGRYDGKKKTAKQHLKNRWSLTPTKKTAASTFEKALYSTAPHYHLVERGHQIKPRRAKKGRVGFLGLMKSERVKIKNGKTTVDGTYFFKKTMDDMEDGINQAFEDMVDDILGGLLK